MEKLQRFSIRKLSFGAVSCLIGTVSFLSYSYKVQAAETPQTVETAKTDNEIQPKKAQESKQNEEVRGDSQKTGVVTTVNQATPKENVSATNEVVKANEAVVINKAETNKLNGERNETGSVDTTVLKTNIASKEAKQNIADLAISTKMKLQAIRLAKPVDVDNAAVVNTLDQNKSKTNASSKLVQTVSPEQSADITDVQPASDQVESASTNSNALENNVSAASAPTVLSKQPANAAQTNLVRRPVMRLAAATATNSDELIVGKDVTISDFSVTAAEGKNEFENSHANIKFTMHADDPSALVDKRLTIQLGKIWDGFYHSQNQESNPTTISYQGQVIGTLSYGYPFNFVYITFNNHVKDYTKISVQPDLVVSGFSQDNLPYKDYLYTPTQAKDGQTYHLTNDIVIGQQKYSSNLPSTIHYRKLGSESVSSVTNLTTTSYGQHDRELYAGTFYKTPDGIYYSRSAYYSGNNLYDEESGQPGELEGLSLNVGTDVITDNTQSYTATVDIDQTKLSLNPDTKLVPIDSYSLTKNYWDNENLLPNTSDVYSDYSQTYSSTATADATVTKNSVIFNKLNGQSLATQEISFDDGYTTYSNEANYIEQHGQLYITPALFKQLQAVAESDQNLTEALNTVTTTGRTAEIKLANPIDTGVKATIKTSDGKTKEVPLLIDTIRYGMTTASTAPKGSILVSAQGKTAKVYHPGDQNIPAVVDQSQLTKTITRTINVHEPGKSVTTTKQTVTLTQSVSVVDGKDVTYNGDWKVQGDSQWASYDVPSVPGYTASQSSVAQQAVTDATKDQTVNITYIANPQTSTVVYQTEDGTPVHTTTVNGKTGQTVKVSNEVPVGWHVVNGTVPSEITFGPNGTPKTVVTIAHSHATVTSDVPKTTSDELPDNPGKTYPAGVGETDLNKTITRTIKVTMPDGQVKTIEQTSKLTRTADVDEVTGEVKYSDWSTSQWDKYDVPSVPGYTSSQPNVADQTVTNTTKDATVTITYTANEHQISIEYVDNVTGKILKTDHVSGKTGQTVSITPHIPDGWELVSGQSVPNKVTLGADGAPATVIKVQPQERSVAVKFVDDQSDERQVGQAVTLTGRDGGTVDLHLTVPDKYQLADGQQLPTAYTFKNGSSDLTIHLIHQVVQREAAVDVQLVMMTEVDIQGVDLMRETITQERGKQLGDNLFGVIGTDMLFEVLPSVEVGTLTGHVNYDVVDSKVVSFGDDWTTLNLGGRTYQLPNGTDVVNGVLIDSDDGSFGKPVREYYLKHYSILNSGHNVDPDYATRPWYGYLSVNETNDSNNPLAQEYSTGLQGGLVGDESNALAKANGDRAATSVEMTNKTIDVSALNTELFIEQDGRLQATLPVPLVGVYIPYVEKTATWTIKVKTPDGKTTSVKQTATLAKQIDFGEDVHPAWTTGEWASYDVPVIPGYTASQSNVAKETVTGTTKDQTVNITYIANDGTQTIVYQDEDGFEIDKQVISGKTDEKVKVTPDVPDGYVLKGEVPSEVTIKPDDTPITVTVEHGKSHVTPDKPVEKGDLIPGTKDKHYPAGLTHDDLNKTITRDVTITDPSGKKTTSVQTVTFTRGATVDEVTGEVAYGNWSENGKHTFDKVDVPYITGYRSSEEVPEVTVTPDSKSNTVDVTYAAKTYDVYIFYDYVATSYDRDNIDSSDGGGGIFYRKDFDKYANGEVGIAKPEVLHGHYGELINIPIKQVKGYHLDPYRDYSNYKFGMDAITGQELNWYNFFNVKDLKDPLPEDASDFDKEYSMPRFIFVDYVRDYAHSGYNNSGYNIGYVDTEGAVIGRPTNLRGISGTDTNFTAPAFEGYTLTNPQDVPAKFGKTSQDIVLVYKPQDVKITYHYVDETGKQLVPSVVENNHFTGLTHVDQKDAKTIPGYSLVSTPEQTVVDGLKDLDLYFTYKANDGSQTISYQDNGQEVGKQVITGKTNQTVKVTPEVPDGYVVKSEIPKEVTIRAKNDAIVIAVEHGKAHISPDKPVNKGDLIPGTKDKHYPDGLTHNDLNKTVTREITITDPTGKKSTTAQTVTFTRGATVDEVTNKVTYDDWSENGKHTFDKVDVPTVPGYTVSGEVPEVVVTPETRSSKVDITYTANAQHMAITYVDDTTGKKLHIDKLDGVSDQDTKYTTVDSIKQYTDLHYKLVSDSTNGKDLIFDHDDNRDQVFEVHFVHGSHDISDKKSITETITYTMSDGSTAPNKVERQVEFNRVGKHDDVTGTDTWDEWQPNKQSFDAMSTPEVKGYTPDIKLIEAKTVTAGDKDITETITYTPNKQKAKVVFIDDTTKKVLDTHDLTGVTSGHEKYNPSEEIEKFIHDNYVFVSSDYPEKGFTYDNDDSKDQVFEVHLKEKLSESDTPTIPNNTEENGGSSDTPTDSDEPEKDNGGSDAVDNSNHKTPVKRNSNKKHHGIKKINNHKNANKKHQGTETTNNQKNAKIAKLNPNEVDTKANKLTQTKLGKVQEPTNNTLPQTGNKQSGLMAALGLAISSLGMIGAVKSKKRKDN